MITATNLLTSQNLSTGDEISTLVITMPKFLVAELNTHRNLSRNSASSRAIPFWKILKQVMLHPYIPSKFGKYNTGMQPAGYLEGAAHNHAVNQWRAARRFAVERALHLAWPGFSNEETSSIYAALEDVRDAETEDWEYLPTATPVVAKEILNRIVEPWMMTTVIATANYEAWQDFLRLRNHPDAQWDMQEVARAVEAALDAPERTQHLEVGEWHAPYISADHLTIEHLLLSASACAKVSYHRQGETMNLDNVLRLIDAGHLSPFEHVARATDEDPTQGNLTGFTQLRHVVSGITPEMLDADANMW